MQLGQFIPAFPEMFLTVMTFVILCIDAVLKRNHGTWAYLLSLFTLIGCATLTLGMFVFPKPIVMFAGMFVGDAFGNVLKLCTYVALAMTFVYGRQYLADRNLFKGEFYILSLFALLGMMVMISANHLLSMYLGLELLSLSLYAMVALNRDSRVATEAAIKYFILGALASGMLLYGMSMLYGATGTLNISEIAQLIAAKKTQKVIIAFALVFIVAGLAFKLGVVPFHMWIPDVYHGAPTAVTLMIGAAPKIAAFAMTLRLLASGLIAFAADWQQMLILMAVLSLAIGNLAAIMQANLKRMLAFSTISHMGFLLLGLLSGVVDGNSFSTTNAYSSAMFYVITYVLTTLGSFGMILLMARAGFEGEALEDFKGLNQRNPWFAWMTLIIMFSLAGIPPTVGFIAKYSVLQAVVGAGLTWLAVVAVLFSLIGAFYYLRVVKIMFFDEPVSSAPINPASDGKVLLSVNALLILLLGLMPGWLLKLCELAVGASFRF